MTVTMTNTYYVLANFFGDAIDQHPWMTSTPFYKIDSDGMIKLEMLSDIHMNFVANSGDIKHMSLYRIDANDRKDYLIKRAYLFKNNDFSFDTVRSYGFEKVIDINYKVDENNKEQTFCGIKVSFCYDRDERMFQDKIYLSLPTVTIK
jgi:hypothetical protein